MYSTRNLEAVGNFTMQEFGDLVHILGGRYKVARILKRQILVNLMGELVLPCSHSFDPSVAISSSWLPWRGPVDGDGLTGEIAQDTRSLALSSIDWEDVVFVHCLEEGEKEISGDEKLKRLQQSGNILLGGNALISIWEDYQVGGEDSVLESIYKTHSITCIDFFGSILRGEDGSRYVSYLHREDEEWKWSFWGGIESLKWERHNVSATLRPKTPPEHGGY